MRFMVIVKADQRTEAGVLPSGDLLEKMGKYNEELARAGVLLAGEGLQASSKGARVRFEGARRSVVDGPFTETKELVSGFWILQVSSREEALEWVKKAPFRNGEVEVRRISEAEDFGEAFTPELRDKEAQLRAAAAQRQAN
jgi:hypothetical protein